MGLIILLVIGAVLGWLATIGLRIETGKGIAGNVLSGIAGSLAAGTLAGGGLLFAAISGIALLWAALGAVVTIGVFNLIRSRLHRPA